MMPGQIAGIDAKSESAVGCIGAADNDSRHFVAEAIVEQISDGQAGGRCHWTTIGIDVLERNVSPWCN